MRETVRSGRRENFYVTDNTFIDHYAREMQPTDIAVYHALERYANCHTRSTWVGTAKIAEVLNVSQRTVQRSLKALEDLKLIRIVQTSTVKMYFIVPVPPRAKTAAIPLFDGIEMEQSFSEGDSAVAWPTPASHRPSRASRMPSPTSCAATTASHGSDTDGGPYKEEQDLLNNTKEQDLFNKMSKEANTEISKNAKRVLTILRLPESMITAAEAAIEFKTTGTNLSMDEVVQEIWTEATRAERRGVSRESTVADYLARALAQQILEEINLPPMNHVITSVTAALKAEAKDRELGLEDTAALITTAAIEDRRKGTLIDRFYFENCKWRSNVRASKAEQRKLNNLEVNARVKQRIRERLGAS